MPTMNPFSGITRLFGGGNVDHAKEAGLTDKPAGKKGATASPHQQGVNGYTAEMSNKKMKSMLNKLGIPKEQHAQIAGQLRGLASHAANGFTPGESGMVTSARKDMAQYKADAFAMNKIKEEKDAAELKVKIQGQTRKTLMDIWQ